MSDPQPPTYVPPPNYVPPAAVQARPRRWVWFAVGFGSAVFVGAAMLLVLVVVAVAAGLGGETGVWSEEAVDGEGAEKIAVIDVTGEIHGGESGGGAFEPASAGARDIISQLRQAAEDDDVVAVVLRIDTPGGAVVASDEIHEVVSNFDKPVVASMADMATSGGYYIAAGTDRILSNPATLTGSIGVIMMLPNLEGAADKLGVRVTVITSGALKDAGSPFRELRPEERELFQRQIDQAYNQFVAAVVEGREMDEEKVRALADGRPFSGEDAKAEGLVDDFGDLDDAWTHAARLANVDRDDTTLVRLGGGGGLSDLLAARWPGSPVEQVRRELGIGFGLKYLYVP